MEENPNDETCRTCALLDDMPDECAECSKAMLEYGELFPNWKRKEKKLKPED